MIAADHSGVPEAWLRELGEFVAIPSVSADPRHADDVEAAGTWVHDFIVRAGGAAEEVRVQATGPPVIVGRFAASSAAARPGCPTVLLYGHHDVQPPGRLSDWASPPFEPAIRGEWLFGRGTSDDKGNLYMLLKAVELLAAEGRLPVDVIVVCDGEEEVLGDSVSAYLRERRPAADACLIFDAPMARRGEPVFVTGTRGLAFLRVHLRTGERDLHSGVFGGATLNAAEALIDTLHALGTFTAELSSREAVVAGVERAAWERLAAGDEVLAAAGARPVDARAASHFHERTFTRSAVVVSGIAAGDVELQANIIPAEAHAHVHARVAAHEDVDAVADALADALRAAAPPGAELEITRLALSPGAVVPGDSSALQIAADAFELVVGTRPLLVRTGGTLPVLAQITALGIPSILTGFDLPEGNIHSADERLLLAHLPLGVAAAQETLRGLSALPRARGGP